MIVAGIDYSMTSPSVCVFNGSFFTHGCCKFYYLTDKKKLDITLLNIEGKMFAEYANPQQRFNYISDWALGIVTFLKRSM